MKKATWYVFVSLFKWKVIAYDSLRNGVAYFIWIFFFSFVQELSLKKTMIILATRKMWQSTKLLYSTPLFYFARYFIIVLQNDSLEMITTRM